MIELTVKTLDSQNHHFSVEDDITVEQFKAHIADTVNIPADTQRIIYCGRVLQDGSKLSEYDVHGKVVHLVQRPPPGQTPRSNSRSSSPQPQQRRIYRPYRMEQGNAMYLGSMAFPGNLMESQGIVPPPPTHSLSGSRLNVARRMLRRAEAVIQQLENPSSRPQEQQSSEENPEEEEVTPVIEARVIVPNNNEPIDEVLNAVQNTLINATAGAMAMNIDAAAMAAEARARSTSTGSAPRSPNQSGNSTPGGPTPRSSSTENLNSEPRSDNNGGLPENALRTTEMADLLTYLGQLQVRFAPFLANYHNFMQQDPEIVPNQIRSTQMMLNRVSEVMHFFSHAYHSLSDIIVRVRTPPARPLLCRPILIQHSAVVQTGIPIQVEAQINLSADRPSSQSSAQSQQQNGLSTTEGTVSGTVEQSTMQPPTTAGAPTVSVQSGFVGLPFLPGTMRVQSFPVEIRALRTAPSTPRAQNNNNNTVNAPSNEQNSANASQVTAPPTQMNAPSTHIHTPRTQIHALPVQAAIPLPQSDTPFHQSAIPLLQSVISLPRSIIPVAVTQSAIPQSATTLPQSAIPLPQSGTTIPQSAIPLPQSAIPLPQSVIPLPQSAVPLPQAEATIHQSTIPPPQSDNMNPQSNNPLPQADAPLYQSGFPPAQSGVQQEGVGGQEQAAGAGGSTYNFSNPNVEFFMEVTPEGITIDSLETTLVGSNQANDFLRGALNGPTPEFLQSIMRMAGQIINQNITTTSAPPAGQATATTTSGDSSGGQMTSQSSTNAQAAAAAATASGQNSQARGNTQTNPTTATSTRSTPRPHVHLAQQAMQGGFDPFLPCNSHHISRRRLQMTSASNQRSSQQGSNSTSSSQPQYQPQQQRQQPTNTTSDASSDAANVRPNAVPPEIRNFIDFLSRRGGRAADQTDQAGESVQGDASMSGDNPRVALQFPQFFNRFSTTAGNLPDLLRGRSITLEQLLHQFQQDDQFVPGESIITDLIMLFIRNLTLVDLFTLNSGNTEPINRNINEIQNFFRTRICDGDITPLGIDRGTERLIAEMQPFLDNFSSLSTRDNINMVRSAEELFRTRLPSIINTAVNLTPETVRSLFDQCVITTKLLLALTLYVSVTGQQGVEQIYEQLMNRFMEDVSPELHNWTLMTSRFQLRQVLSNLNVSENDLQLYIIRTSDPMDQNRQNVIRDYALDPVEGMDIDDIEPVIPTPPVIIEDPEPLPNVILGSEPWHGQVPEDWVPIITRDAQKQRRQNAQGPFSDAYLSGMPSKRRKIVNSSKPQGSLPQVITESVRQAVTATGLTSVAPLETVAQAAGASAEIQSAYRNLVRSTVQSNLRDNEDYLPERFPNVSNYFNSNHQPH